MGNREDDYQESETGPGGGRGRRMRRLGRRVAVGAGILAVLLGAAAGTEYARLSPANLAARQPVTVPAAGQGGAPVTPPAPVHKGTFNVLLLGVDSRTPGEPARSDSIILIHVDLNTHQYNILSIPRDTRVYIPPYGYTKITHANYLGELKGHTVLAGIEEASQIVSNFTGLPIDFYAETNHFGLQSLVDAIGGVRIYVPFNVPIVNAWYPDLNGKTIPKGWDYLDGEMASELVHQRELLPQGDFSRQQLQEDLLVAIAKKLSKPQNWGMIPSFLNALPKFLTITNMTTEQMLSLVLYLHSFNRNEIHYYQVPSTPYQAMDPVVGMVLDYEEPDMPALRAIIKAHFE
jgi:LCP family protein required for cell wall assembly